MNARVLVEADESIFATQLRFPNQEPTSAVIGRLTCTGLILLCISIE